MPSKMRFIKTSLSGLSSTATTCLDLLGVPNFHLFLVFNIHLTHFPGCKAREATRKLRSLLLPEP